MVVPTITNRRVAGLLAAVLASSTVLVLDASPAFAQTASLSIQKVADTSVVTPGQTFNYTLQVQCTSATDAGCTNAVLSDPLPQFVALNGPITVTGASTPPVVDEGPPILITFQDDLGNGTVGLVAGQIVTITVPVVVASDIPATQNGVPITNTATIDADNADPKNGTSTVTPEIPETIAAGTTKEFVPDSALASPGEPVALTLTGRNASNVPVDTLVVQDPIDPTATPNPFDYLEVTDLGTPTLPPGADTVTIEVFVDPNWVDSAGVDLSTVTGIRYIFSDTDGSGIDPGAATTVDVTLAQRANVTPTPDGGLLVEDIVLATVDRDGQQAFADANDVYNIRESSIDVQASKSIEPSVARAGDPATVTLGGTNASPDPITSMTITEPDPLQPTNPFENGLTFTAFTGDVVWPTGTTEATIIYACAGTPAAPQSTTTPNSLPAPPGGCDPVTGFSVTFAGEIVPGATATIPFTVDTAADQPVDELTRLNIVHVGGSDAAGNTDIARAFDTIRTVIDRLEVDVDKTITPEEIPARPGQIVIAQLSATLRPFPQSTVDADQIIVQDPSTMPDPNSPPWFEVFQPQSVTATPVPACSSLTVLYTTDPNGASDSWQPISPQLTDIAGPTIVNADIPDDVSQSAAGITFVYTAAPADGTCEGGFPPSTSVAPNLAFALRPEGADLVNQGTDPIVFTDCAASGAENATVDDVSGEVCDDISVNPTGGGPGELDPIDKAWDLDLVNARSQAQVGATISWSTEGYSGLGKVVVTDIVGVEATALPASVFDEFDLVRIDPIEPVDDPHLTYDQVVSLELFQLPPGSTDIAAGGWVAAPSSPCPAACDGTFPGYTIPVAARAVTVGFRLTYVESPTRVDRLDAGAPPVGTGVAPSSGNDRDIHPVFQLRDDRRSNPDIPVISDIVFNTATPGEILNTTQVDGYFDPTSPPVGTWTDGDTIQLADVPVTVNSTKTWAGGPLGIPEAGVPQDEYPTGRVTITGTNTTPAKIDELAITDDTLGEAFEWFNLSGFSTITPPEDIGASDVTVSFTGAISPSNYTRADALALTEADLTGVTGFTVTYTGRIDTNRPATVVFDTRLRTASRTGNAPPQEGQTIGNQVTVDGADLVDYPGIDPATGQSTAIDGIDLVAQGLDVTAFKSIAPATQTEPDNSPVTVTLGGQPSGPSRTVEMVLTDTDPRFWNQYDFVGLDDVAFTFPIDRVQVDALTGGTWSVSGIGDPALTGASWHTGTPTAGPTLSLPPGVTPGQVQGVRFVFTRADGANWENPSDPDQRASFRAQRRAELNTGGPVPLDLDDPAPGETLAGRATDAMTAEVTSSDVDASGNPLAADATASDTIDYLHATNSVAVAKTPDGTLVAPGAPFTYTLTATNNGDVDIGNPVIVDDLPVDADGPMVVVSEPHYTFDVAPATVTTMPTDPSDVTVTQTSTQIEFTFPVGSTLPVGATYTISFDVSPRPGLPAETSFTNTFGITGDRPWDACDGVLDPGTGRCTASATNGVLSAGALSVNKLVRGEGSDVLGVVRDPLVSSQAPCVADGDGFYARPCVPVAEPGGDITWRLHFVNTGNRPIDRILGIDSLPAVGDTLATVQGLTRGSQWTPTLTGERPALVDPGFGTLHVWYTTGASACEAVAPDPADDAAAPPNLLCPDVDWVEWPAAAPLPVDPATVTGVQIEILPTTPFAPAATTDVDLEMVAPAFDPNADVAAPQAQPDRQAYNTVGTSGRFTTQAQAVSYTLPSEPPRVGVALATGPLAVEKVVTGDASRYAPATFAAGLSCTSAGVDVPLPLGARLMILTPGQPRTIHNLPWGATCTLTEIGDAGQTSSTSTSATVRREGETIATARITNVYDDAPLTITKRVASSAVDDGGRPIAYGPFVVEVRCTFRGRPAYADGYGPLAPMNLTIAGDQTVTLTGLPVGSTCTITETDDKGAVTTTLSVVAPGGTTNANGTTTVVQLAGTTTATIANRFDVGSVRITKTISGNATAPGAVGPFSVAMACTLSDESGTRSVWDGVIVLGGGSPMTRTIGNLATGAVCTFSETVSQGASSITISPTSVTVGDGTIVGVTVDNTFPEPPLPPPPPSPDPRPLPPTGQSVQHLLQPALLLLALGFVALAPNRKRRANGPAK